MFPYFLFVPAHKMNYLNSAEKRGVRRIILDLEDSVPCEMRKYGIENIKNHLMAQDGRYFVRVPIFDAQGKLTLSVLNTLVGLGIVNFMIPKLETEEEALALRRHLQMVWSDISVFLLVESPRALMNLHSILTVFGSSVRYISLGIYDYAASMGVVPSSKSVLHGKLSLLQLGKAFGIKVMDSPLLSIDNRDGFLKEASEAFDDGFDGKLLVHPSQYTWLKSHKFISDERLQELRMLHGRISRMVGSQGVVNVDGQLYERPHLSMIKRWIDMEDWSDTE